ncbi:MAG: cytochrome P450 [Deltaproteobacteria bacterium]|nr:cytochrome P450 [Kofleriaceae bacterium]
MRAAVGEVPGLPVIGNLLDFRRDRLGLYMRATQTADITRLRMMRQTIWVVGNHELAQQVLVTDEDGFIKGPILSEKAKPLLGDGLLTAEKEQHRRQRKLMAPAFTPRRIAGYGAVMAARAAAAADGLRPHAMIDIAEAMMTTTLDIVGRTLFDVDLLGDARDIADALTETMEYIVASMMSPLPASLPSPRKQRVQRAVGRLDDTVLRVIAERRAARARGAPDRGDVLSILLEARDDEGGGLTDRQLRDEIMVLMLAGHETTANLLAWTWYLLAIYPEVERKLEAELDAVLDGRPPTVDDLPRLTYTAQILDEALRLYPPAYVVGRLAERTVQLGGATVQPGEVVLVSIRGMHHSPVYWDAPLEFRPERFADRKARTAPGYMPWGGGPRVCIGNHFALVEAALVVATWAQRYRFRLAQAAPIEPEALLTLRPRGGVWVEVEPHA